MTPHRRAGAPSVAAEPGPRATHAGPQQRHGPIGSTLRREDILLLQCAAGNSAVAQRIGGQAGLTAKQVDAPKPGINKVGFIDSGDGSNIRTAPSEMNGTALTSTPMPPATRVFVSGVHPQAPEWQYVTAFLDDTMLRGYVQGFRVNTDLPEPMAKLYEIKPGDTAEKLAVQEFKQAVRDGHDLRYYETYCYSSTATPGAPASPAPSRIRAYSVVGPTTSSSRPDVASGWSAPATRPSLKRLSRMGHSPTACMRRSSA